MNRRASCVGTFEVFEAAHVALRTLLAFSQPVNCIFWPIGMLNWLVAASKLHKHREKCCTAEWPFYSFLILCCAGFFRFLQKACGFFCQRNASVDQFDFMLVQPNVLEQDGRIPAPLECYIKCPTTLNFLNNKFPPLENIRTSKCPNYARGGGCYPFVLIGA